MQSIAQTTSRAILGCEGRRRTGIYNTPRMAFPSPISSTDEGGVFPNLYLPMIACEEARKASGDIHPRLPCYLLTRQLIVVLICHRHDVCLRRHIRSGKASLCWLYYYCCVRVFRNVRGWTRCSLGLRFSTVPGAMLMLIQ